MSSHFLDLPGAAAVATDQLLDAREMIHEVVAVRGMAAIHGAAGTGKSFAVAQVLRELPRREVVAIDFRCRPTLRDVRHSLHRGLGLGPLACAGMFEADMALKSALGDRPRLLVIDEAQWLTRECFEYLRHLHDDPDTVFGLLFVGGAGCFEVLRREPMLDSRLYAHLRFEQLSIDEVLAIMPVYHGIYGGVDDDLLMLIDRRCAHGNFRNWAKFTQHALRFSERVGRDRLDKEITVNVFRMLGGAGAGA